jgi:cell division protein FtsN
VFGRTQRGASERPNKHKKPLVPTWLWMLVVILIVLCFTVALMLWKPWAPVQAKPQVAAERIQEDTNQDYRFYDLLPQQQVTPIPDQAVPENKNAATVVIVEAPNDETEASAAVTTLSQADQQAASESAALNTSYILQIRSYRDPDQADARRAEIILNGLSADVLKINEQGEVWYRVISGPYNSQKAALIAQQTLQHSGIDSIVIKH